MTTDFSQRDPLNGVLPSLVQRWSPRAFVPGKPIEEAALARILDAARFAPSAFNAQPWRFYTSNATTFDRYLSLLVEANQVWAKNASVIGFLVVQNHFSHNGQANPHALFDGGAAWLALALQAQAEGLHSHAMGGFLPQAVMETLGLDPAQETAAIAFALGYQDNASQLPEGLQALEQPSPRQPLATLWRQR